MLVSSIRHSVANTLSIQESNIMVHINDHYLKLKAGYLFPEIARRVDAFAAAHPQADVIRLGIGDVVKGIPRGQWSMR